MAIKAHSVILCLISSLFFSNLSATYVEPIDIYSYSDKLLEKFILKKKSEGFDLWLYGIEIEGDLLGFNLGLRWPSRVKLEEAREIYIALVEEFLHLINQDKVLRPYLHHYPFTATDAGISLSFELSSDERASYPYVHEVSCIFNKLIYTTEKNGKLFFYMHEESYDEALKIVREGKKNE